LVVLSAEPFDQIETQDSHTEIYQVGDPTFYMPLDTLSACHFESEGCKLQVLPIAGERFIKLGSTQDFITVYTSEESDVGSYDVFLVNLHSLTD
jgi:hypothetical protein